MIQSLIDAAKQFRFMTYPGKTHGIGGSADRDHLFHMIQDHFERELKEDFLRVPWGPLWLQNPQPPSPRGYTKNLPIQRINPPQFQLTPVSHGPYLSHVA